jgi:hypothetical protein
MDVLQYVFTLILTIVSASAGVLGALIGYRSALRTTQANIDLAREQRRFERAQEMRAEVIPKLFLFLQRLEDQTAWVLDLPVRGTEWMRPIMRDLVEARLNEEEAAAREEEALEPIRKEFGEFEKQLAELREYFLLNRIWLPEHLVSAFVQVMDGYEAHEKMMVSVVAQWAERGQTFFETGPKDTEALETFLNQEREFYEAGVRGMRNWFEGDRLRQEAAMWSAARQVLAVEE